MGLSDVHDAPCPTCGTKAPQVFWASLDCTSLDQVMNETLQRRVCEKCKIEIRFPPDLTYFDPLERLWIAARPLDAKAYWAGAEQTAKVTFEENFGAPAPATAQEIGNTLNARVTFGWSAFREKLIAAEYDLDDVTLEILKLVVIRDRPGNPFAPGNELRLEELRAGVLEMSWIEAATDKRIDSFEAPLRLYESLHDAPRWKDAKKRLSAGLFVDVNRILIPCGT